MPLTLVAENFSLHEIYRNITQIGVAAADPGVGQVPNPGEPVIGVGGGYMRQPHYIPLMAWGGSGNAVVRNVFPVTFSVPACTLLYVTFWFHVPSYYGYTYGGDPEPLDAFIGSAPIGSSRFGFGTIKTDGTITSPRHGLPDGAQVRLQPVFLDPLPDGLFSGPLYTVSNSDTDTLNLVTNEGQTVTITGAPTGGTLTLTLDGHATAAIPYNATLFEVATKLEALPNVGAGNVHVSGGRGPSKAWTVAFAGDLTATNVALMSATGSFTGGDSPGIEVATAIAGGVTVTPQQSGTLFWQEVVPVTFSAPGAVTIYESTIILSAVSF